MKPRKSGPPGGKYEQTKHLQHKTLTKAKDLHAVPTIWISNNMYSFIHIYTTIAVNIRWFIQSNYS